MITVDPDTITDLRGNTAVFTCSVTGRPRPNITWWREDDSSGNLTQVTDEEGKTEIESEVFGEDGRMSSLTIMNIAPSDAGVYVCQAENDADTAETQVTLTVHGKFLLELSLKLCREGHVRL